MNRNLYLWIEYEGTRYRGWQRQPDGPTVQQEIEDRLAELLDEPVRVQGAGRTDAGVHALGQTAHCHVQSTLPDRAILHELNHRLPEDIVIRRVSDAPAEFRARRHARIRHYRYRILNRPLPQAVDRHTWAHMPLPLDRERIGAIVERYAGEHEFAAFRSSACSARRTRLTMLRSHLTVAGDRLIFEFTCRSFLHNMVRILVGTAIDAGRGRISLRTVDRLLAGMGDRTEAGRTAPPEGLILVGIEYVPPFVEFSTFERPDNEEEAGTL